MEDASDEASGPDDGMIALPPSAAGGATAGGGGGSFTCRYDSEDEAERTGGVVFADPKPRPIPRAVRRAVAARARTAPTVAAPSPYHMGEHRTVAGFSPPATLAGPARQPSKSSQPSPEALGWRAVGAGSKMSGWDGNARKSTDTPKPVVPMATSRRQGRHQHHKRARIQALETRPVAPGTATPHDPGGPSNVHLDLQEDSDDGGGQSPPTSPLTDALESPLVDIAEVAPTAHADDEALDEDAIQQILDDAHWDQAPMHEGEVRWSLRDPRAGPHTAASTIGAASSSSSSSSPPFLPSSSSTSPPLHLAAARPTTPLPPLAPATHEVPPPTEGNRAGQNARKKAGWKRFRDGTVGGGDRPEAQQPVGGEGGHVHGAPGGFVAWERRFYGRMLEAELMVDEEVRALAALDSASVAMVPPATLGGQVRGVGEGADGVGRACAGAEGAGPRKSSHHGAAGDEHSQEDGGGGGGQDNEATAGAEQEQSAGGAGGGCSFVMRRADFGRGDGSRRNDAVEVGGVASVRGSGAAASAGLEGGGEMSCGSSEGAVSGVSRATGGCASAGGGAGADRAIKGAVTGECDRLLEKKTGKTAGKKQRRKIMAAMEKLQILSPISGED